MRPRRSLGIAAAVSILLAGATLLAWAVSGSPPPRLALAYGLPPAGGPTGRREVVEGIEFIELSPGTCLVGSHYRCERGDFLGRFASMFGSTSGRVPLHVGPECPRTFEEIRRPFFLARTEVTNGLFEKFAPGRARTSSSVGDDDPVLRITGREAGGFCAWFSARSGHKVRLPTDAEWEYACRTGETGEYSFGDDVRLLMFEAWYAGNSNGHAHEVGRKSPNRWGFHDLMGNALERTSGPEARGGSFASTASECRAAARQVSSEPVGLRLAMESP